MSRTRVTIAGAGAVGAACAQRLAERDYADIVLYDRLEGLALGRALDLAQAAPLAGYEPRVVGTASFEETGGSDVCVIAAGLHRRPGMSRDDLTTENSEIVDEVVRGLAERSPDAILVIVTNPLEVMCHVALDASGFPRQRVLGIGGVVDSARFRSLIAAELGVSVRDVAGLVLGAHDETMVPVIGSATVGGMPAGPLLEPGALETIAERVREAGSEVIDLVERGSAVQTPSAGVVTVVDAIVRDAGRLLACSALCQGDYGVRNLFSAVPCRVGASGVEEIVAIELGEDERRRLAASAEAVGERVAAITGRRSS